MQEDERGPEKEAPKTKGGYQIAQSPTKDEQPHLLYMGVPPFPPGK